MNPGKSCEKNTYVSHHRKHKDVMNAENDFNAYL